MTETTLIAPESGVITIESCAIFNHPRIRGRYRSSHLWRQHCARMAYPCSGKESAGGSLSEIRASPRFGHANPLETGWVRLGNAGCVTETFHHRYFTVDHGGIPEDSLSNGAANALRTHAPCTPLSRVQGVQEPHQVHQMPGRHLVPGLPNQQRLPVQQPRGESLGWLASSLLTTPPSRKKRPRNMKLRFRDDRHL